MIQTISDKPTASHLMQEAAEPLAPVLRTVSMAPGTIAPSVAAAVLHLAAEAVTAEAESCSDCPALPDLCPRCEADITRAVTYQLLAQELRNGREAVR